MACSFDICIGFGSAFSDAIWLSFVGMIGWLATVLLWLFCLWAGGLGVGCVGGAAVTLRGVVVGVVYGLCAGWWDLFWDLGWLVGVVVSGLGEVSGVSGVDVSWKSLSGWDWVWVGLLRVSCGGFEVDDEPESLILAQSERWRNA